jgi:DNA-binding transcriptional ArsR family regulator
MKKLKRAVIKEELVELTGDFRPALILNQFIYWIERMYDTDKYILEEKERALKHEIEVSIDESKGWVYKTAEDLNEELMIGMSVPTIRKYIKQLVEQGYLVQRKNPKYKWDKTMQYRVDLYKIQLDLGKMGYVLEGFKLLPNIKIVEEVEEAVKEILTDVEPEYFYTEAEIKQLLQHGSLDQLLDCLDYAPEGVISLVKNMAVDMKLNDVSKRDAIKDKTGFDVSKAIEIKIESEKTDEVVETSSRRAAPIVTKTENEEGAARRTTAPRYNVVVE